MGIDWIESQDELCLVKSTVVEVVKKTGTSVLNAEDNATMSVLERARGKIILFSLDPENPKIKAHTKEGGTSITLDGRNVVIRTRQLDITVCTLEEIPITFSGIIDFNTANALAAIGALHGLGLPLEQIRNGIMTFYPSVNQNPGRMNLFDFQKYKVLLDYGHNPDSARAFARLLPRLSSGRKLGLFHGTGNRTSEQLIDYGKALALVYDYIMLTDFDPRSRPFGETPKLVYEGLIKGGFSKKNIEIIQDPDKAVDYIFSKVKAGDLLVIQPDELEPVMGQIMQKYRQMVMLHKL